MEEELGQPLGAVYSSISERPIAAASLGQVRHKLRRAVTGTAVCHNPQSAFQVQSRLCGFTCFPHLILCLL